MAERTVRAKLLIDVGSAVANVGKVGTALKDASKAGTDFARENKQSFDDFAGSAARVGATAAVGLGLAIAKFAEFDKQMSAVKAATGETTGNMKLLREAAISAGKDTAFSATEAAQGIENLAKAGVETRDILGGGLKGALDLAAAGEIGVAEASEVAATAMTQFKLSGKDVPHIADLLAAGAGKAQGEVSDMAAALKQGGLVASQFGLTIEESTGTLAAFASAGLIGSDAGTSFKTMLIALANPSKESASLMKELGLQVYDAQGQFIGTTALAEQLRQKLSGLTAEQRNAALAQIFGNDAVRAANVLYEQGGAGIAEWVTKVNDAGYASETAATKTDNLAGDVERLGGSFDTALIQSGSGANDVLRAVVQTADSAVSAFANLPSGVQAVGTAFASIVTIGGLGAAALLKAATGAGELRAQWQSLGRVGKTLTLSMGAVGIALTAAAAVYGVFAQRNADAKQQVDDLRSTLDEATGAITGNTRAYVANELAQSGLAQSAKDFGLNLATVTDAALGNQTALDSLRGRLEAIVKANTSVGNSYSGNNKVMNEQGQAARDLLDKLNGMSSGLSEAQQKQKLAAEGAGQVKTATELQAEAHAKAQQQIQAETQSLQELISAMSLVPGQVLSLREAYRQFQESADKASEALKENGRTLDITTPKGRENQAALDAMARSANNVTTSMIENGKSNTAVVSTYATNRAGLIKTARQFGMNKAQAEAYAASVLAIPKKTNTDVKANITDLEAKLRSAKAQLKDPNLTKERKAKLNATIAQLQAQIAKAKAALASVPSGKTVDIRINTYKTMIETTINRGIVASGQGLPKAYGGPVPGYSPHSRADNIPLLATAGEWVHQVPAVNYYGPGIMDDINNMRIPKSQLRGYADGGQVARDILYAPRMAPAQPAGSAPVYAVTNVTIPIEIGGEVTRVVNREIRSNNAALKRSVQQNRGR